MKRIHFAILLLVGAFSFQFPSLAEAAQIRAYVAEFTVHPAESGGLKTTLQTLLATRMASEAILPVATAAEAEVLISGNFTQIGKIFSLDAVAKLASGRTLATVFEQGESLDTLIPAIGKMAAQLRSDLPQHYRETTLAPQSAGNASQPPQSAGGPDTTVWRSQRITGAQMGLAPALTGAKEREFFLAEPRVVRLYRQENTLKLLAELEFPLGMKVIAIDSVGPDKAGHPRVYVSIMDGEKPASQILSYEGAQLKPVATRLPYMFRAMAFNGGERKIYAQQMSMNEDYYGDIYEVSETNGKIALKQAIKLPRFANIFNYSRITGADGKSFIIVLSPDGYLVAYSEAGEELWRGSEKFGGSETNFQRQSGTSLKNNQDNMKWTFIDQRISTTVNGEIIVPQNSGFFVMGNSRSYTKYAVACFSWNGSSLEERWRTKENQNYLADYNFDPRTRELTLLEMVQKEGVFSKGASSLRVIRAD